MNITSFQTNKQEITNPFSATLKSPLNSHSSPTYFMLPSSRETHVKKSFDTIISNPDQPRFSSDTTPSFLYKILSSKKFACLPWGNEHTCVPASELKIPQEMPQNSLTTAKQNTQGYCRPIQQTNSLIQITPKTKQQGFCPIQESCPMPETTTEKVSVSAKDWFSNLPALSTMFKIGIAVLALAGISYAAYTYFTPSKVEKEKEEKVSPIKPVIEKPLTFFERIQKALNSIWISIQSWVKKLLTLSSR